MSYFYQSAFKAPKFLVTTHTSAQATSSSANTFQTILGSEISYAPTANSTKVIYEISYYAERLSGIIFQDIRLQESSDNGNTWSEIDAKFKRNYGNSGSAGQSNRWYLHFRFVLPTWSGEKQLRLSSASNSNYPHNLHQISEWDGANATDQFCDTSLLVYSI